MRVLEIWRYPVKSLQGEQLDRVDLAAAGLDGDRRYALFDVDTGFGLTARREPGLLFASATAKPDGPPTITLPDGSEASDDDALSDWLGRRVELRCTDDQDVRRYENLSDFENEPTSPWEPFDGASGAFHDTEGATVTLLSTSTIGDWDRRRFRPNLLLDGSGEDDLVGSRVRSGAAVLAVNAPIERCVMTTRAQPDGIGRDLDVLRTIHRQRGGRLAVGAVVATPGQVRVGDELVGQE